MKQLNDIISEIKPLEPVWIERAAARQAQLTKPPGSLGKLEEIANRLCAIRQTLQPSVENRKIVVFAGDHGVCAEGVSPYPQAVTTQMIANFINGGAAINALAKIANARLEVVDVGVAGETGKLEFADDKASLRFSHASVAKGTRSIAREAAMTIEQMYAALTVGIDTARRLKGENVQLVGLGEMGIGNTTVAGAVTAALTGLPAAAVVGRGTGANDQMLRHKINVVEQALKVNQPDKHDALDILRKVGGLEIAALIGLCLAAAANRIAIVMDGFITTAAAALAIQICPAAGDYVFAAHRSTEPGHRVLLERIGREPLLDLGMRLGEGTGAALAINIIAAATAAFNEMATFETANVSGKE